MQKRQKKKMKYKIRKELGKSSAMTEEEEENVFNVWTLSLPDRWRLYRYVCFCVSLFFPLFTNYSMWHLFQLFPTSLLLPLFLTFLCSFPASSFYSFFFFFSPIPQAKPQSATNNLFPVCIIKSTNHHEDISQRMFSPPRAKTYCIFAITVKTGL